MFGGTFDPVHHGHLRIALDAYEALELHEVRLVPLARAVHRDQPQTPGALRLAMLQAALDGRSDLVADDRELARAGPSYTVDTLRSLHDELAGRSLCLLIGGDAFQGFSSWREPHAILELANIAVLQRPGPPPVWDDFISGLLRVREVDAFSAAAGQIRICPVTQLDISSSDIRARIAAGLSADFLTPAGVLAIIHEHHLYR